ncbi:MutS-related protein [Clostridium sp. LP20]|uniref:MutS-related protein n=1 Tax=Clostridium sp. LP20 TaxID=3418665 RepID=UPI003EE47B44
MNKAEKFYDDNIKKANEEINKLNQSIAQIGWARLLIVLVAGFAIYKVYKNSGTLNAGLTLFMGVTAFIIIATIHGKKINRREKLELILEVNNKGIKRLNGEYRSFVDKGEDLIEEGHPFCEDLDVFGQNSLFQMINTTRTKSGRRKLGELLSLKRLPTEKEIQEKQIAIKELGEKVEWRQKLYVDATFKKSKGEELEDLIKWSKEESSGNKTKILIASTFIAITLIGLFLAITKVITPSMLILDLIVNYGVIKVLTKDREEVIKLFHSIKYSVKSYSNILSLIEDEEFESSYLQNLKKKLNEDSNISCKVEMKKLSSLLDWVGDSAGNAYFFIINVFVFADVFILYNLNRWKEANGDKIEQWLEVMGEFDALCSISNISFDHEEWSFAKITEDKEINGVGISHPLIGDRAVANDYELNSPKQITLITGSNMSGKSTFLRTVGINIVLAYIGAPSCAKSFRCSIMNIYTCMRTKDNLEESISSFYAEILRIKLIIEACKRGEKVLFLLDEIFKGTNSRDRHIGATVLVKQLAENGAIGLLSTHDLELCDLEESMREIENYNFREFYDNNRINFDYKLRRGKSTTQNAVYLMRIAGIEIIEG